MKIKLAKFNDFSKSILPIEADLLKSHCKFEDDEKNTIFGILLQNAATLEHNQSYSESIDKRKYSFLKLKCTQILEELDVDKILEKIQVWEQGIILDKIEKDQEKACLSLFKNSGSNHFHFLKLYELARVYRHYLLIRMKLNDYQLVNNYITKFRSSYLRATEINDKLNESTVEIVKHYIKNTETDKRWFEWLSEIFYDETLDGQSRVLAWIRLIFIAHNRKHYDMLTDHFHFFESKIKAGHFYSKRILTNFYSQYVLYHAHYKNFKQAIYYGYQSIKIINNDSLYYINNLSAVLLRAKKAATALDILKKANSLAKNNSNEHSKIGHAAFTIFAYLELGQYKQAQNHAYIFYRAFRNEIVEHRWQLFFSAYFKALLINKEYLELIKIANSCHLIEKDKAFHGHSLYRPTIPWMIALAKYKTGMLSQSQLEINIKTWNNNKSGFTNTNQIADLNELTSKVMKA
ncbi:MAG TPA: hypothetical protein PK622_02680 [Saprospiraceae bacterium]|jgi:hypothetical protein|nr:hypothetical protein [Saprospiraceae bacterium]